MSESKQDNQKKIINMFNNIADTYDKTNSVISFGVDASWRNEIVSKSLNSIKKDSDIVISDFASGTGDMVITWDRISKENGLNVQKYIVLEPAIKMLDIAREKLSHIETEINYINKMATESEIDSSSVDIISISYGLRNVKEWGKALGEFNRILSIGGIVAILEFTQSEKPGLLEKITSMYTKNVLPIIGGIISRDFDAYKYLPNSIDDFLTHEELVSELENRGFENVEHKKNLGNASSMFIFRKTKELI